MLPLNGHNDTFQLAAMLIVFPSVQRHYRILLSFFCEWWAGSKVHAGTLKDNNMRVVIKVQHLGMEKVMASDLRNIGWV